ncbi:Aste57867_13247 [Aphanomyces stellatus]|uniref:Aste57867_13247 protein n=1 Tax=Aphanomyces stellatus TaxID=120398 RepID=A0A485KYB4_9STRA|nr:hypothetical protein As57867_013198 [Aphanomyces stellatus]VFT90087.1 Aste57867_13247 [Aphanomyces stellatus]
MQLFVVKGIIFHGDLILGVSGRKKTWSPAMIERAIKSVPHEDRQTLRSLAAASAVPKTTIIRHMQEEGRLSARVNYVKPLLTDKNKEVRVQYAKSFLRPSSNGHHVFDDMHDYVHVDEKWFYLTKVKRRFCVYDDEDVALRSVKSKNFITKVMFLASVARPRYDPHTKMYFDGKLGV